MESDSQVLQQIVTKYEDQIKSEDIERDEENKSKSIRVRLQALTVALLGISMSVCALASHPVELELEDEDVVQRLNNVSLVRRITKPTIRILLGYGKLSAIVTSVTSFMLLIAVMSKNSWWQRGARWLAAPALLVTALEVVSDAGDTILTAVLVGNSGPLNVVWQLCSAAIFITMEILVWYFIAKFFEQDTVMEDATDKEIVVTEETFAPLNIQDFVPT